MSSSFDVFEEVEVNKTLERRVCRLPVFHSGTRPLGRKCGITWLNGASLSLAHCDSPVWSHAADWQAQRGRQQTRAEKEKSEMWERSNVSVMSTGGGRREIGRRRSSNEGCWRRTGRSCRRGCVWRQLHTAVHSCVCLFIYLSLFSLECRGECRWQKLRRDSQRFCSFSSCNSMLAVLPASVWTRWTCCFVIRGKLSVFAHGAFFLLLAVCFFPSCYFLIDEHLILTLLNLKYFLTITESIVFFPFFRGAHWLHCCKD